jgi:hypothetical protein
MPPIVVADSPAPAPAPAQRQARRPPSRIVPAIPHRLSRSIPAARPVTPEESNRGAVTQNGPDAQVTADKQADEQLPPASAVDAPLTPDSRASGEVKSEEDATVLAASPAESAEDHIERAPNHEGSSAPVLSQLRECTDKLSIRLELWQ